MAGIYLGKLGPAAAATIGVGKEVIDAYKRNLPISKADVELFKVAGDIGERVHDQELKIIGYPIRKTICK